MAESRKTYPKLTSFRGIFVWPKLDKPDYGNKQFPDPDGKFKTRLRGTLTNPAVQAFIAKLQPLYDAALAEAREKFKELKPETRKKLKDITENQLYTELLDAETEEPTGEIEFNFSRKASGEFKKGPKAKQRWNAKLTVYDAKGKPMLKVRRKSGPAPKRKVLVRGRPLFHSGHRRGRPVAEDGSGPAHHADPRRREVGQGSRLR